jgi:hypothetical protein
MTPPRSEENAQVSLCGICLFLLLLAECIMGNSSGENGYNKVINADIEANFRSEFISRKQLLEILEISDRTLQRIDARRKGPPRIRVGKKTMYYMPAVREWLLSCLETPHRNRRTN